MEKTIEIGFLEDHCVATFVYNMLNEVFDENVFDEIFGTSTYYPVLQQALFHCAPRTDIQNFFLAWAPSNMGVLRTVVGDAYLMYLVYNAYPSFFTTQVMDNIGVEEFYRAFERMTNFKISDLMALLQNSMDPGRYDDFAASVPSFLTYEEKISLSEHYIYGSQRLGAKKATKQLQSHTLQYESGNWLPQEVNYMAEPVPAYVAKAGGLVDVGYALGSWLTNGKLKYPQEATYTRKLGFKEYELTNHLGNVQATILDRRLGIKAHPSDTIFSYVEADVKTAQDYYPFGMMMPGRNYTATSSLPFRYGFQGQERDDEVYGKGNAVNFKYRMHDTRIGRFFAVDPLAAHYPWNSPYAFAENKVIQYIELEGLEIALPRILPRVYLPRPQLTLPRNPVQPIHPIPPIVPTTPQVPNQPGSPSLPNASNSEAIRWEDIDMTNPQTWPKPPVEGEVTPGEPSRKKNRERGEKSLFDKKGGEWRPHKPDKHHDEGHWDYKPPGENTPWENVYKKDLPAVDVYPRKPAENSREYRRQMRQYEREMKRYEKEKEKYYKECGCQL